MNPFLLLVLSQLFDYVLKNRDAILAALLDCIPNAENIPSIKDAMEELRGNPSAEAVERLATQVEESGELTKEEFANLVLNQYNVKV